MEKLAEQILIVALLAGFAMGFIEPLFLKLLSSKLFGIPLGYLRTLLASWLCIFVALVAGFVINGGGDILIAVTMSFSIGSLLTRAVLYGRLLKNRDTGEPLGFGLGLILTIGVAALWVGLAIGGFHLIQRIT